MMSRLLSHDGPRSRVLAEAHNRLVVQMAVLHRLLAR